MSEVAHTRPALFQPLAVWVKSSQERVLTPVECSPIVFSLKFHLP